MKKIKALLFIFVALFAFVLIGVKAGAEDMTFDWKADDHAEQQTSDPTKYSAGLAGMEVCSNGLATVSFGRSGFIRKGFKETVTEDGNVSFTYAAVAEGNTDTVKNASLSFEAKKAGVTIDIWYTITISDWFKKDISNTVYSGQLVVLDSDGQELESTPSEASNHQQFVAYHASYTVSDAGQIVYIVSTVQRLAIFAIRISEVGELPNPSTQPTINLYQQSGISAEGAELVRYIAIVENVAEENIAGSFTLVIHGNHEALADGFDVTDDCVIANHLTSNGQTYQAKINDEDYTFDVKENVLYVVCVVAVANYEDLADEYQGVALTATLTVEALNYSATTHPYIVEAATKE